MYKLRFLSLVLFLVLLSSCAPILATPSPAPASTNAPPVVSMAVVQSVEVQILDGEPLQANAIIRGQLPDGGCTTISSVDQARNGNTFNIQLITTTDPLAICTLAATPFEQIVPLEVSNLSPTTYTVNANGVEATFELLPRDPLAFQQVLVDALNRRDYELQKILMDRSFMIGYWLSEGTENTPDDAIQQLQTSLLSPTTPVTPDYNKNLRDLLDTDPVIILGPDVPEARPVFVSGLGTEGKDEGILFVAKRPDGGLYWHGLLFAKDGFTQPIPVPVSTQPVDMNAYETNIKYVMALQDVNIRSGPGTQFRILSYVAEGQTAKVTGMSANGNWWRVICPDDRIGSCWVSALSGLTKPTDGPLPQTPPVTKADVQSVEIQILESFPVQANAIARGQFPDAGCTTIAGVNQSRSGNTFTVTLTTKVDPNSICSQVITPFEYVVSLDVSSLLPAQYIVNVNGVEATFDLPAIQPTQVP